MLMCAVTNGPQIPMAFNQLCLPSVRHLWFCSTSSSLWTQVTVSTIWASLVIVQKERDKTLTDLKLLLRKDTYHLPLHFVGHAGGSGFNRMRLSNTPPGRGSRWIWTEVHSSLQCNRVKRFLWLFKEHSFTLLGGRGKKQRRSVFWMIKIPCCYSW